MLITEAAAQTAEAIKAASDAGDLVLQYKVLGAACVILGLAVGVLFWRLTGAWETIRKLTELVSSEVSANKTATLAFTNALERVQAAQATSAQAVQEQSHETAKEISETRHAVANHHASVNAVVNMLVRHHDRGAA